MFEPKKSAPGKPVPIRLPIPHELMETAKRLSESSNTKVPEVFLQAIQYAFESRSDQKPKKAKKAE